MKRRNVGLRRRDVFATALQAFVDSTLHREQGVGNAQPFFDTDATKNLRICLPSFSEQQKIVDCFTTLDKLITTETKRLDTLRTHKIRTHKKG